jgi:hypothetical protein
MSDYIRPFEAQADTVSFAVGATATTTQVNPTVGVRGTRSMRLVNSGAATIFWKLGDTAGVTTSITTGTPMLPNTTQVFLIRNEQQYLAHIGSAAGNTLYVTLGESSS